MDTLKYITEKYNIDADKKIVEIPNIGRSEIPTWLNELKFKKGVEVGVAAGEYSLELCKANSQMEWVGIDPWEPYFGYRDYMKLSTFQKLEQEAREKLSGFSNYTFIKDTSMTAIDQFEDESIDFCYLDANHQEPYITQDIKGWYEKIRKGGILAGHDYVKSKTRRVDVIEAINQFVAREQISPLFILGSFNQEQEVAQEDICSWMIIKQ